jgi:hypothetical protein
MAYMCLTVLDASAGGSRKKAAAQYAIAESILRKLGELCSTRGSRQEARKAPKTGVYVPLTSLEKEWIQGVVKKLIRRLGEWAYDQTANLTKITMTDLPKI